MRRQQSDDSGSRGERSLWEGLWTSDDWSAAWVSVNGYAVERVEAIYRAGFLSDSQSESLDPDAIVERARREIAEGKHEPPRPDESLCDGIQRVVRRVLFPVYLGVLSKKEQRRLDKLLWNRAITLLPPESSSYAVPPVGGFIGTAEDLVQEVFIRACSGTWEWKHDGADQRPPAVFLFAILRSITSDELDRWRRNRAIQLEEERELESSGGPASGAVQTSVQPDQFDRVLHKELLASLHSQSSAKKLLVYTMHRRGDTLKEIRDALGVPEATAHRWIEELKTTLRSILGDAPSQNKLKKES